MLLEKKWLKEIALWKQEKQRIVFTNGCFDLFHFGHLQVIKQSAKFGDKLIVGINSDASIKRLKGSDRPVVSENERQAIIASLKVVDMAIIFGEDTPFELIEAVVPDVLVKGDDYKVEDIVGSDIVLGNGGSVETIKKIEGYSTSLLIDKISKIV